MQNLRNSLGNFADGKASQQPFLEVSVATVLTPNQNIVRVVGNAAPIDITLPPVGDCAGRTFAITAEDGDDNTVTVKHAGDSRDWADEALAGDGAAVLYFCDGQKFWPISTAEGTTT